MADLDEVHELLAVVEETIENLNQEDQDEIDVMQYPDFCMAINDVVGWGSAYGDPVAARLGVSPTLLTKFTKFRGTVKVYVAKKVADRMRSYLRELDQGVPAERRSEPDVNLDERVLAPSASDTSILDIPVEQWKYVHVSSEMSLKIGAISSLLDTIIVRIKGSNSPPDERVLSDIERQQLVAVLETALSVLKSPLMEKGLLTKARDGLNRAAGRAAEKQAEQGLGNAAGEAGRQLLEIIKGLF